MPGPKQGSGRARILMAELFNRLDDIVLFLKTKLIRMDKY
jgi:hypothetical protein